MSDTPSVLGNTEQLHPHLKQREDRKVAQDVQNTINQLALDILQHGRDVTKYKKSPYLQWYEQSPTGILWIRSCLSQLSPKIVTQDDGSRPFSVIRKIGDTPYLGLDIGKEYYEKDDTGKPQLKTQFARVFFWDTLKPIMLQINPKTWDILTTDDGKNVITDTWELIPIE